MRLQVLQKLLRQLLCLFLCLAVLWSTAGCLDPSSSKGYLCINGRTGNSRQKKNAVDDFSTKAVVDATQARAYLSPTVFLGTLRSVLVQRDRTVRAWFRVDKPLKEWTGPPRNGTSADEDIEVVYHRSGDRCVLEVNQDNMRLGSQYLVFGNDFTTGAWTSLTATASPIPNDKRILRAAKKILCKDCAKPPSLSGLERDRVEEGSRVRLNCHLAGNPIPWVQWYKDGAKVADRGRVRVKTKRRTSRLVIRHARSSDRGLYECRAGNVVREDPPATLSAPLVVTRKRKKKPAPLSTTTPPPTTSTQSNNPWATEPCPTSDFCLNGGTCIFYKMVREYVCKCAEGFVGLRCDYKDVSISVGEVKNSDQAHGRLFIDILVLFLIFFTLNWACVAVCWLCCFRWQQGHWGIFQGLAPLCGNDKISQEEKASVDVAFELADSRSNSKEGSDLFHTTSCNGKSAVLDN